MGKYKVQVKVELIECNDDAKDHDLKQEKNGNFTMTISEHLGRIWHFYLTGRNFSVLPRNLNRIPKR